jgi:hypothetical protein
MEDTRSILSGECLPWPAKERLAAALREGGLDVFVGEYSVRVRNTSTFALSFEHYGGDICEPAIRADADDAQVLIRGGKVVSSALAAAGIRHPFEIYDSNDVLVEYLHFEWPMPDSTSFERTRER